MNEMLIINQTVCVSASAVTWIATCHWSCRHRN